MKIYGVIQMEIRLRGEMTFADIWQALFEQLCTLEDEYAVRYSRGATLFLNPTDGLGEGTQIVTL